ncbi:MAG: GNAT family N-acetyltransferase [Microbacteriaceae bacterium]
MIDFRATRVTDPLAHSLLSEYFTERAETFPSDSRGYRTTFPEPEQFVEPNGVFLMVVDADAAVDAVGCGGVRRLDAGASPRFEVKHLWLRPEVRGRGWGGLLLAELERRAYAFGAAEMVLDTNASLLAAGHLYRAAGYRQIAPYNDNPNATTWYAKTLTHQQSEP